REDLDEHLVGGEVEGGHAGRDGRGSGGGWRRGRSRPRGQGDEGNKPSESGEMGLHGIPESRSANTNPSRLTTSPPRTGTGRLNMGPAQANVWNSPFSPQTSTPAGRRARRSRSKAAPANARGITRGSTQVRRACSPPAI